MRLINTNILAVTICISALGYSTIASAFDQASCIARAKQQVSSSGKFPAAERGLLTAGSVKSPLDKFSYGLGVEMSEIASSPFSVRLIYGLQSKSKINSLGVSYKLSDNLSSGVTFIYANGKKREKDGLDSGVLKEKLPAAMLDLYYKVPMYVSPYAGISLGYAKHKLRLDVTTAGNQIVTKNNYTGFAYGVGAGVIVDIAPSIGVDIGYKLTNFGSKDKQLDIISVKKYKMQHNLNLVLKVKL